MGLYELKVGILGPLEVAGGNVALHGAEPGLGGELHLRVKAHDAVEADPGFQEVAELLVGLGDLPEDAGVLGAVIGFLARGLDSAVNVDGAHVVAAAAVNLAQLVEGGDADVLVIVGLQDVAHHLLGFLRLAVPDVDLRQDVGRGNEKLVVGVLGEVRDGFLSLIVFALLDQHLGVLQVGGVSSRALGHFPQEFLDQRQRLVVFALGHQDVGFRDFGLVHALDGVGVFAVALGKLVQSLVGVLVAAHFHVGHGQLVKHFHVGRVERIVLLGVLQGRNGGSEGLVSHFQGFVDRLLRLRGRRGAADGAENKKES